MLQPCQAQPLKSASSLLLILMVRLQAPAQRLTERAAINGVTLEAAGVPTASTADAGAAGPSGPAAERGAAAMLGLTALNYAPPFELGLTDAVRPLHMLTVSALRSRQCWRGIADSWTATPSCVVGPVLGDLGRWDTTGYPEGKASAIVVFQHLTGLP